jgi:hypothetical protein
MSYQALTAIAVLAVSFIIVVVAAPALGLPDWAGVAIAVVFLVCLSRILRQRSGSSLPFSYCRYRTSSIRLSSCGSPGSWLHVPLPRCLRPALVELIGLRWSDLKLDG